MLRTLLLVAAGAAPALSLAAPHLPRTVPKTRDVVLNFDNPPLVAGLPLAELPLASISVNVPKDEAGREQGIKCVSFTYDNVNGLGSGGIGTAKPPTGAFVASTSYRSEYTNVVDNTIVNFMPQAPQPPAFTIEYDNSNYASFGMDKLSFVCTLATASGAAGSLAACTVSFTAIKAGTEGTIKAVERVEYLPDENPLDTEMYKEVTLPKAFSEGGLKAVLVKLEAGAFDLNGVDKITTAILVDKVSAKLVAK